MSAPRGRRGSTPPIELRIVVWQFVRIMVQLETAARARGRQGRPALYDAWRAAWQEIDRRLTQLGKTDAAAFADLMMNQEVVVVCRNRAQLNELIRTVDNVVHQLKREIKAAAGDTRHADDLRFERSELESFARDLRNAARVGAGNDSPATPRRRASR